MDESEQVSQLIGDIYDAALDPAQWTHVLEQTCGYVRGVASALVSHDSAQKSAQFHFAWGDDPFYSKLYNETYVKLNPVVLSAVIQTKVGEVSAYLDLIPEHEYRSSRFYKEWAGPQGYVDAVQVTLEKSATSFVAAAVMRHERDGIVDAEVRRRMGLLAPHFRRAVAIGKVIDLHKVEVATLADTLDGLAAGMFLVDADARVVHANASGHALLENGDVLTGRSDRLSPTDSKADRHATASAGSPMSCRSPPVRGDRRGSPTPRRRRCSYARPRSICPVRWRRSAIFTSSRRPNCAC